MGRDRLCKDVYIFLDVGCSEMQKNVIAKNVMQKCH